MPNPRKLLYPFSLLYQGITEVRNQFYDRGIFNSSSYDLPVIAVGNLNTGGTGKSPMIEYLLAFLSEEYKVATLSRGYKRESKGFQFVEKDDLASKSGDEPLQFKNKFPGVAVAVDANRREGIEKLRKENPEVILLDDAFQHRKVTAGLYILLTSYGDLFTDDLVLPAGNLRESKHGANRANIVVVTKCPERVSAEEREKIIAKIRPRKDQQVYFSKIGYSEKIYSATETFSIAELQHKKFHLVTGIANPDPLISYLKAKKIGFQHLKFPDHHCFSDKELQDLNSYDHILTTEKDYMRLKNTRLREKLYYLPIRTELIDRADEFEQAIKTFVNKK